MTRRSRSVFAMKEATNTLKKSSGRKWTEVTVPGRIQNRLLRLPTKESEKKIVCRFDANLASCTRFFDFLPLRTLRVTLRVPARRDSGLFGLFLKTCLHLLTRGKRKTANMLQVALRPAPARSGCVLVACTVAHRRPARPNIVPPRRQTVREASGASRCVPEARILRSGCVLHGISDATL